MHLFTSLDAPENAHLQIASGHIPLPVVRATFGPDWLVFTCLRNPVHQLLSHLRWLKHVGATPSLMSAIDPSLKPLVSEAVKVSLSDTNAVHGLIFGSAIGEQMLDSCQVRYLIPRVEGETVLPGHASDAVAALKSLDAAFVVEQADTALPAILRMAGIEPPASGFPQSNVGPHKEDVDLQDDKVRDFYRRMVERDATVFSRARDMGAKLATAREFQQ